MKTNHATSRWLAVGVALALIGGPILARAADQKERQDKPTGKTPVAPRSSNPAPPRGVGAPPTTGPTRSGGTATQPGGTTPPSDTHKPIGDTHKPIGDTSKPIGDVSKPIGDTRRPAGDTGRTISEPRKITAPLTEEKRANGTIERKAPSGVVRERVEKKPDGEHTVQRTVTGRVEKETVQKPDGTKRTTTYDLGHREKQAEVVHKDGTRAVTDVHYNRFGTERARETVTKDSSGRAISKTVEVRNNLVIKNTTVVRNTVVVRNYYRSDRCGFIYHPFFIAPFVFASWYDPYWYSPVGVAFYHPFHYSWGWEGDPWYRYHAYYWEPYPVYPAPSYWVTDWMVAGYVADRYAVSVSAEQTREEVRLAREDADKARLAAEKAQDAAEKAEARAAQAEAEARAERAEARAAKAERDEARHKEFGDKPNPNAKPIDKETKEALKDQVEKTIAEKKAFTDQTAKGGNPVPPDVTAALADPKHIFPVSKNLSVTRAEDSKPAGILTAGDLLKLEPGQEQTLKTANENTPINMRVITSKGEDDSVPAGTLVAIPLKELQEFDNEFKAKLDLGLTEADKNKELFKKGVEKK